MPLESMYLTPARFNRILELPPATRPLIAPRSAVLLSPMRTSPFKSRIATSPACRCLISNSAIAETSGLVSHHYAIMARPSTFARAISFEVAERFFFGFVRIEDRKQLGNCEQVSQL